MDSGGDEVMVPAESPPPPPTQALEWKFSQVFGERTAREEVQEDEIFEKLLFAKPVLPYPLESTSEKLQSKPLKQYT
ncbi:hypothetical protein RJ639_036398 [Escallonia herrerae]|uniref:Uncharacterized protein n=1 Tax=Escallonia herrerae TaxID=1293975 RepID=A0AA89B6Z4_9ASTE|nr:hypothetical protein RJ639_036398 [Escallonia herrerae]